MARAFWPAVSAFEARNPSLVSQAFRRALTGRLNVVLDVTLTAGTSTVVDNALILEQSAIIPVPADANAAALGVVWSDPATQVDGQFTLTHPTAAGGEAYRVLVIG